MDIQTAFERIGFLKKAANFTEVGELKAEADLALAKAIANARSELANSPEIGELVRAAEFMRLMFPALAGKL